MQDLYVSALNETFIDENTICIGYSYIYNKNSFMLWTNATRMVDYQPCSVLLLSDRCS